MMTGKLTYRVDDNEITLVSWPDGHGTHSKPTGTRTADLQITIDLDKLRPLLIAQALCTKRCRSTRANGAIVVEPVKGTVKQRGHGRPRNW
jgi:hypothetical protein